MTAEPRAPATEFIRFCECLNRCGADYVIVGSEAVAFHGAPRYSADFDAFVRASRANLLRVIAALELFGAADLARNLEPEIWAKSGATIRIGSPPLQVDVLLQLSGVSYDLVVRSAMTRDLRLRRIASRRASSSGSSESVAPRQGSWSTSPTGP
jgi:hypothetical protein